MAELRFPASRLKPLLRLILSLAMSALFVWLAREFNWKPFYIALAVPVAHFIGAVVDLVPGSGGLRIDDDGVTYRQGFWSTTLAWHAVERFRVVKQNDTWPPRRMVGYDLVEDARRSRWATWRRSIHGYDGVLPDTYGHTADELAELLQRCHAAAHGG